MDTPDAGPPVILAVEDIDWIRAGMTRALRRHGFRVLEAAGDAEAVEVVRRERPDLILTEERLPAFDALLARVRELPANLRVPVVVVNPDADAATRYGDAVVLTDFGQLRSILLRTRTAK